MQFFREASDVQFDETGNRKRKHRYGDEDEIEMEQQERKRRQILNKEFKSFAEKIADAATSSVSIFPGNGLLAELTLCTRRLATHWKWIFPSENFHSRAFLIARMFVYNRRPSALFISPIPHSLSPL